MNAKSKTLGFRNWSDRSRWVPFARLLVPLLLVVTLLVDPRATTVNWQPSAVAHHLPFTVIVYDYTSRWGSRIDVGVRRWDAALAYRGIRLTYVRQAATSCEELNQPASGVAVCDAANPHPDEWLADGEHQEIWAADGTVNMRGRVRFFDVLQDATAAAWLVCHELGHTLQLMHVPEGTDSCMTTTPGRTGPSAWDAANAFAYIPDESSLTVSDHANDREKAKRDKKKEQREKKKDEKKNKKKDTSRAKDGEEKRERRDEERDEKRERRDEERDEKREERNETRGEGHRQRGHP